MKRILVIGGNGSGKTTFSLELSRKLNLPLVHLDQFYWKDNWEVRNKDVFDEILIRELENPKWIIDGNIIRTIPMRLAYCDTVIYFDFPTYVCLYGTLSRVVKNYGKSRPDMGGYCPERFDLKFTKNVWYFNKRNRKKFYDLLNGLKDTNVIVLKNRKQVASFLDTL